MRPGRITRRAAQEYLDLLEAHLRARLDEVRANPKLALDRAEGELRTDLESCADGSGRGDGDLVTYRGPRPLRCRIVVERVSGDVVSVLPQSEHHRRQR